MDGTLSSTSGKGLTFSGTDVQNLGRSSLGTSDLGIVTINNSTGVQILDGNSYNFNIQSNLRLEDGVFNIGGNLLTIESTASITEVNTFSEDNMIQTNNSFGDNGLKKAFPASTTTDFTFPIGEGSYSPVVLDLSSTGHTSGTTPGSVTVRTANEFHPSVNDGMDALSTGDVDNVLQFYWAIDADNLDNSFEADIILQYSDDQVKVDQIGETESNYISARILSDNNFSGSVNKAGGTVDDGANTITFSFSGTNHEGISGDYFAGISAAIPDNVITYTAIMDGNVGDAIYSPIVSGGGAPSGAILIVPSIYTVTFNDPNIQLYRTVINGTLDIDATTGHRLGTVTGTGDIRITSNTSSAILPAGFYTDFFTCGGGGLEYDGSGSYQVLGGINTIARLTINGSGTKTLAGNEIIVCNDLTVNGTVIFDNPNDQNITIMNDLILNGGTFNAGISNTVDVDGDINVAGGSFDHESSGTTNIDGNLTVSTGSFDAGSGGQITIRGDLTYSGGTFNGGDGTAKIVMQGSSTQVIDGDFTGTSHFHGIEFDNTNGISFNEDADFDNVVVFTDGIVDPGANTLTFNENTIASPEEGTATSFIQGPLSKIMSNIGDSFTFPVGSSRWGYASVNNVSIGGLTWTVQYFTQSPTSEALVDNGTPADNVTIKHISTVEYWKISDGNTGGATADIGLRWDTQSIVSATKAERETLEVMAWNDGNSNWDNYGGGNFVSGHTQSAGYFEAESVLSFSEQIVTLGTGDEDNPLPVELVYFDVKALDNVVTLNWLTASEINNDYFEIQRSVDGESFEVTGVVNGNGTSNARNEYEYIDRNPYYGISFYRLRQVDFDGKHEMLPMKVVDNNFLFDGIELTIYPNPTDSNNINIRIESGDLNSPLIVEIISTSGRLFFNETIDFQEPQNQYRIDPAKELKAGVYLIRIRQGNNIDIKGVIIQR